MGLIRDLHFSACLALRKSADLFLLSFFSQYALLLSYFQYCQHVLAPDVPATVLQSLLLDEQDGEDLDLQKVHSF